VKSQQSGTRSLILNFKLSIFIFSLFTIHCLLFTASDAKVYIDITSPGIQKLPISITAKGAPEAKEIEAIIINDLDFTGLFSFVAPEVPGAEIIVQSEVSVSLNEITVLWSIIDLVENREVLKKRNTASRKSVRAIAHNISNDIYKFVTEKEGVFRTKISYLVYASPREKELRLMDWDGFSPIKVIGRFNIKSRVVE
jgi:Tol biopolymer transport system component